MTKTNGRAFSGSFSGTPSGSFSGTPSGSFSGTPYYVRLQALAFILGLAFGISTPWGAVVAQAIAADTAPPVASGGGDAIVNSDTRGTQGNGDDSEDAYHIFMVLWRGETDVEAGFRSYARERDLPFRYTIVSVDRDRTQFAAVRKRIRAEQPDLVYTWGTSVTLGIFGNYEEVQQPPHPYLDEFQGLFTLVSTPVVSKIVPSFESSQRNITGVRFIAPIAAQLLTIRNYRPID
ncbi:MAG: hypothetical protein K0U36_06795, partial [Alphaproteobacteria bacterium]|nr:hypothetical protein [Alphaproteobacteria bacterium]